MNMARRGFAARLSPSASIPRACESCGSRCPVNDCRMANPPLANRAMPVRASSGLPSPTNAWNRLPRSSELICKSCNTNACYANFSRYTRPGSRRARTEPSASAFSGSGLSPSRISPIWEPGAGRSTGSPDNAGRRVAPIGCPRTTRYRPSTPPRARNPATLPSAMRAGSAGRKSIPPSWLCSSISAMAAVPPKLPSI